MNISDWRVDYDKYKLDASSLHNDPILQFKDWFAQAKLDGHEEPNAMVLATCGNDMIPDCRMVLLKEIDDNQFVFYTNYNSHKGKAIAENPKASLLFYWEKSQRQVRISGILEKGSAEKAKAYFASRPLNSQISAIASPQSEEIELEVLFKNVENILDSNQIECPPHWGSYYLKPFKFEFWQGQPGRLHDRITYQNEQENWIIKRIAP